MWCMSNTDSFLYYLVSVRWIFVHRSYCSLSYVYGARLCTGSVVRYVVRCMCGHRFCFSLSDILHVWAEILLSIIWHCACLGRDSVVHYLIGWMFGQRFSYSLPDIVHVGAESLLFVVSHIQYDGSSPNTSNTYSGSSFFQLRPNTGCSTETSCSFLGPSVEHWESLY
jgi:hypothetical protein